MHLPPQSPRHGRVLAAPSIPTPSLPSHHARCLLDSHPSPPPTRVPSSPQPGVLPFVSWDGGSEMQRGGMWREDSGIRRRGWWEWIRRADGGSLLLPLVLQLQVCARPRPHPHLSILTPSSLPLIPFVSSELWRWTWRGAARGPMPRRRQQARGPVHS
jgi:hypothetical protein